MGWAFARFWGVSNWASTLVGRLSHDPGDIKEISDLLAPCNNWEDRYSKIDPCEGDDLYEVRLVNSLLNRENGHRDDQGLDHWTKVSAWSKALLRCNVGYRFVRYTELGDKERLLSEDTPLIIDNCGVVSDEQYQAVKAYLDQGGKAIIVLPFGTKDQKGLPREKPLSDEFIKNSYPGLTVIKSGLADEQFVTDFINGKVIVPRIRQLQGDDTWAVKLRKQEGCMVMHLLNRAIEAVPHPELTTPYGGGKILYDVKALNKQEILSYVIKIDLKNDSFKNICFMSPETGSVKREVKVEQLNEKEIKVTFNVKDIKLYGIVS